MARLATFVAVLLLTACGSGAEAKSGFSCDDLLRTQVRIYAATGTLRARTLRLIRRSPGNA
jgi:uncharacterized lipoprotein YmbA